MRKIYKISKYFIVTGFVVMISSVIGQKHSSSYTFAIPEVSADVPAPTDGSIYGDGACGASDGGTGGADGTDGADGGASSSDDGGVDGASADGPGDGACAA